MGPEIDNGEPMKHPDKLKAALEMLGLPPEHYTHFDFLVTAQGIYSQRYMKYHDKPIEAMGAKGTIHEARVCMFRAWQAIWENPNDPFLADSDDLLDGINYLVHTARQAMMGNYEGWFPHA